MARASSGRKGKAHLVVPPIQASADLDAALELVRPAQEIRADLGELPRLQARAILPVLFLGRAAMRRVQLREL